jgi:aminoglycoside phosphotransferase (APT) family kinase protein
MPVDHPEALKVRDYDRNPVTAPTPDSLAPALAAWAEVHYGEGATVSAVETMPGHAGLSFGFDVRSGYQHDRLVIRLPPKGVRRSGNTDVLRQVPLLTAVAEAGIPVPPVRWWGEDERWFGVPYLVVDRIDGATLDLRHPAPEFGAIEPLVDQAVDALGRVHALDWTRALAGWSEPRDLADEIQFWDPILAKGGDPQWMAMGETVRALLLEQLPVEPAVGLFHGDFQVSNLLFHEGRLAAVLDWEISGIGAVLLDLGWFLMMTDPESWDAGLGSLAAAPPAARVVDRYERATGRSAADIGWYRALAGYRFGAISAFNVMLHRSGKRPDPQWDVLAPSINALFGRAEAMLRGATS